MLKSSFCDYSDAYILVSGTKIILNTGAEAAPYNKKNLIIRNCAQFANCIGKLSNTYIIADFPANNNNSVLLKFKTEIADKAEKDGTKMLK